MEGVMEGRMRLVGAVARFTLASALLLMVVAAAAPTGAGVSGSGGGEQPRVSALNPNFEAYLAGSSQISHGYVPSIVDLSHVEASLPPRTNPMALQSRFDPDACLRAGMSADESNLPPTISGLPDVTIPMNSSLDNALDLWAHVDDAEDATSDLTFAIRNVPVPAAGVSLDAQRYIDVNPAAGWTGMTDVEIEVGDTGALTDADVFQVTVRPIVYDTFTYLPIVVRSYAGWVTIVSEDFEGPFPNGAWDVRDNRPDKGSYFWGKRDCRSSGGSFSAWSVGAGDTILSCGSDYRTQVWSWMIYGPFSLADATVAELSFDWWSRTEREWDTFFWGASIDNEIYEGYTVSGNWSSWTTGELLDLSALPYLGSLLGESEVWIAFVFTSSLAPTYEGTFVDNVLLRKSTGSGAVVDRVLPAQSQSLEPDQTWGTSTLRLVP